LSWTYEHAVSGVWNGWLPISLYPYALVEDGTHGLALAVSLDSPRLVKLAYDQVQGRYEARGYLGISPIATKLNGRADSGLELYRVEPELGFRAVMERFATRHSGWFESPRPMYGYRGFNGQYYTGEDAAYQALVEDENDMFSAQYVVAEAPLNDGPVSGPLPSYDETIELVQGLAGSSKAEERAQSEAITQSVAYDPSGDWMLKHVGEYPWAPGVWQVSWATSVDPDITAGWGPYLWESAVSPAMSSTEAVGAVLDGVMIDNFLTAPGVNTRLEHLALFYGIFPNRKDEATGWEQSCDELLSDTLQVLFQFWGAGWEAVTYARAEDPDVWMERFGGESTSEGLYFTVHNVADVTCTTAITIECVPLGLAEPGQAVITELVSGQGVPFAVVDRDIVLMRQDIVASHHTGTRYNIHVDANDGLLYAGEPGVQLTWMDAKVGDLVVTPRIGKPVEVNALWHNALRVMAEIADRLGVPAATYEAAAERARAGFARFWNEAAGYCYDVLNGPDGHDAALRPNQLLAVSLPYSPLDEWQQRAVVDVCARQLLTLHGLRTLAPDDPAYVGHYSGGPGQRNAAYHQGTVWGWLIGPFVHAHLRVYHDPTQARSYLRALFQQLVSHGMGSISEVFDGDAPFAPRGCIAQAWSVAELLRAWRVTRESARYAAPHE